MFNTLIQATLDKQRLGLEGQKLNLAQQQFLEAQTDSRRRRAAINRLANIKVDNISEARAADIADIDNTSVKDMIRLYESLENGKTAERLQGARGDKQYTPSREEKVAAAALRQSQEAGVPLEQTPIWKVATMLKGEKAAKGDEKSEQELKTMIVKELSGSPLYLMKPPEQQAKMVADQYKIITSGANRVKAVETGGDNVSPLLRESINEYKARKQSGLIPGH